MRFLKGILRKDHIIKENVRFFFWWLPWPWPIRSFLLSDFWHFKRLTQCWPHPPTFHFIFFQIFQFTKCLKMTIHWTGILAKLGLTHLNQISTPIMKTETSQIKLSQIYLAWKLFELGFVMISSRREGGLTAYFMSLLKLSLLGSGGRGYCVIWHLSLIFPFFFLTASLKYLNYLK